MRGFPPDALDSGGFAFGSFANGEVLSNGEGGHGGSGLKREERQQYGLHRFKAIKEDTFSGHALLSLPFVLLDFRCRVVIATSLLIFFQSKADRKDDGLPTGIAFEPVLKTQKPFGHMLPPRAFGMFLLSFRERTTAALPHWTGLGDEKFAPFP